MKTKRNWEKKKKRKKRINKFNSIFSEPELQQDSHFNTNRLAQNLKESQWM